MRQIKRFECEGGLVLVVNYDEFEIDQRLDIVISPLIRPLDAEAVVDPVDTSVYWLAGVQ